MSVKSLAPVAHRASEEALARVRPLPDGGWVVSGSGSARILDDTLKIVHRWDFGKGPVSIDDQGERAAVALWPDVAVYDKQALFPDGLLGTFQSPVPDHSTSVLFDERSVYFMGFDEDLDEPEFVLLLRGDLDTQEVSCIGRTSIVGQYEILPRRAPIPGLFVTAWDGQHGAATTYFPDGEIGVGERVGETGREWTAVFDVSPNGSLYLEGGSSVAVRRWSDRSALPLVLPPELEASRLPCEGRFLSDSRLVINHEHGPQFSVLDLAESSVETYQLLDDHGNELDGSGVFCAAGRHLCVLTRRQHRRKPLSWETVVLLYEL